MHRSRLLDSLAAPLLALAALAMSGCATAPTAVSADTEFKPNEGLVAVRVVELGDVPIKRFSVVSEATGEVYPMRAIQFGQTSATTYVGRLPAGRYQPKEMWGTAVDRSRAPSVSVSGGAVNVSVPTVTVTVPLASLTGKFDVQARRITDLGTIVFVPTSAPGSSADRERKFSWNSGAQIGDAPELMQPLWTDPSGKALYTMRLKRIVLSKDQGQSWMR